MGEKLQSEQVDRKPTALDLYLIRKVFNGPERDEEVFAAIDCLMEMDNVQFRKNLKDPLRGAFIFSDAVLIFSSFPESGKKLELKVKIRDYLIRCGEIFDSQDESQQLIEKWELV